MALASVLALVLAAFVIQQTVTIFGPESTWRLPNPCLGLKAGKTTCSSAEPINHSTPAS